MNNIVPQKKLVLGLGKTGFSCVSYLVEQGYEVMAFDTRQAPPYLEKMYCEFPQVDVVLGELNQADLSDFKQIIVSPGLSLSLPILTMARQMGIEIIGDVQLFAQQAQAPIIAITGSNGKTTTTSLVTAMFKAAGKNVLTGGNIGVPALDLLKASTPDYYILELSSFQLETTPALNAEIAVVLNISEDHMDRYENIEQYAQSKLSIYVHARHKLYNADDEWMREQLASQCRVRHFSLRTPAKNGYGIQSVDGEQWIAFEQVLICKVQTLKMTGRHQLMNAIAAIAIGDLCQLPRDVMCGVLREFAGLPHRTQFVAEIRGVTYVNDSKATNIGATLAAVTGLDKPIVLIAGGESKGANFSGFAAALVDHVKQVVLIGRDASLIEKEIGDLIPVVRCVSLPAAVKVAADIAKTGDCVLLSPACASFDMFDDYQHRGNVFIDAVKALK